MVGKLDGRIKAMAIALFILAVFIVPGASQQAFYPAGGYGDRALFLEHYLLANGTVIEGTAPYRSVNFPSYWYNENARQLNGKVDFPVNSSLVMVFGDVLTLKGNFGAGTGNKLYGVYSLPVNADEAVIYSIDKAGTIAMKVNDKTITLKPGESYSYTESEILQEQKGRVKVQYNNTYVNHGFIDKKAIGANQASP